MAKKKNQGESKGASGEQTPHAIFPKPLPAILHGLYLDLVGFQLDRRTRIAQAVKKLTSVLLERFPSPAPAAAQLLAQRTAFKLIRAASFEVFILNGGKAVARAENDYVGLTESIRKDIQSLWVMGKDGSQKDPVPSLGEYLEAMKEGKLHVVKAEKSPEQSKAAAAVPVMVKVEAEKEKPAATPTAKELF